MRELFTEVTGFDICKSITIASACMRVFRSGLEKNKLALIPNGGYEDRTKQSVIARKYLKWYAHHHKVNVQHVENGGEKRVGNYRLDGYVKRLSTVARPQRDLALEVNGLVNGDSMKGIPYKVLLSRLQEALP